MSQLDDSINSFRQQPDGPRQSLHDALRELIQEQRGIKETVQRQQSETAARFREIQRNLDGLRAPREEIEQPREGRQGMEQPKQWWDEDRLKELRDLRQDMEKLTEQLDALKRGSTQLA